MVWKSEGGKRWMFIFDYENRLSQAWDRKNRVTYKYDALGRRVAEYAGTRGSTKFTHDGEDVLADDSTVSGVTKYQNGPGIDNKLSVKQGTTTNYFVQDHLGSTDALTDNTGAVTSQARYDSFGNPSNSGFPTRYQFTGREFDSFTGLQYSRARFYDPKLGRFISEDPIGFEGGDVNLYGYIKNAPLKYTDPFGKFGLCRELDGSIVPCPAPGATRKLMNDLACKIDGYNPWLTLEFGGGLQFGPLGGSDAIVVAFNPLTFELAGQTRLMSGNGGATGILATAGLQVGVSLGPRESGKNFTDSSELFGDAAAFGGGSGSVSYDGSFGTGVGAGPVIGGGAAAGLRIGATAPLFSINAPGKCDCQK